MTENEKNLSDRVDKCEAKIETLRNELNKVDKSQVEFTTKLDNVLVELGKLSKAVEDLKSRPAKMWEKLVYAIIGACATGLVAAFIH